MTITSAEQERVASCSICRHIKDVEFEDCLRGTGGLPEQAKMLVDVPLPEGQFPWLERCPECGTFYSYEHAMGYMEDDITLRRLSDEDARLILAREIGARDLGVKVVDGLAPGLHEREFNLVYRPNPWGWLRRRAECAQIVEVRTVERHGLYADYCRKNAIPRQSLLARCGVFYDFIPILTPSSAPGSSGNPAKRGKDSLLRPAPRDVQIWTNLECPFSSSPRREIWRVEKNGGNLNAVLAEVSRAVLDEGLVWVEKMRDYRNALQDLEARIERLRADGAGGRRDYLTAYGLAEKSGDEGKTAKYRSLLERTGAKP